MKRSGIFAWIGFFCGVLLAGTSALAVEITAGPTVQCAAEDSVSIVWVTDTAGVGWVEYGKDTLNQKAFASEDGLAAAWTRVHKVRLTGLKKGTPYKFRVCAKELTTFEPYKVVYGPQVSSEPGEFCTLDGDKTPFSFIVVNDVHNDWDAMKNRIRQAATKGDFDFAVMLGDIITDPMSEDVVQGWMNASREALGSRCCIPVRGNHETRGRFARELKHYLGLPQDRYYYSFEHGGVYFVVLDGGEDKPDSSEVFAGLADFDAYRSQQTVWLKSEVKREAFKKARFRVVLMHMPLYSEDSTQEKRNRELWGGILNDAGIDLFLAGHTHAYEVLGPQKKTHKYPVVIGGGSDATDATYMYISVTDSAIEVKIVQDGRTDGQCTVKARKKWLLW